MFAPAVLFDKRERPNADLPFLMQRFTVAEIKGSYRWHYDDKTPEHLTFGIGQRIADDDETLTGDLDTYNDGIVVFTTQSFPHEFDDGYTLEHEGLDRWSDKW
jgi:hypothetical protein